MKINHCEIICHFCRTNAYWYAQICVHISNIQVYVYGISIQIHHIHRQFFFLSTLPNKQGTYSSLFLSMISENYNKTNKQLQWLNFLNFPNDKWKMLVNSPSCLRLPFSDFLHHPFQGRCLVWFDELKWFLV